MDLISVTIVTAASGCAVAENHGQFQSAEAAQAELFSASGAFNGPNNDKNK